jgi:hydroxyacylglutathione hydrolase
MPNPQAVAIAEPLRALRIVSRPFEENTYLLTRTGSSECLIVDPGFEPDPILEALEEARLVPAAILLTHGHSDHIAGNAALRSRFPDLPILIGEHEADKLVDPRGNLSAAFGLPLTSPPADRLLADGEHIDVAGFRLRVAAIPGHSSGHVVYLFEEATPVLAVVGDVLFREGIGRTDFPDGDFAALERGIRGVLYRLPGDTIVLPGHGDPTTVGHERSHNPFVRAAPDSPPSHS